MGAAALGRGNRATPSVVCHGSPARSKAMRCLEIACGDMSFQGTSSPTIDSTQAKSKSRWKFALDECCREPYRGSIRRVT